MTENLRRGTYDGMAKARAAHRAKLAHHKTLDLLDESYFCRTREWEEAAKSLGLTLPPWSRPITVKELRAWLGKVGLTVREFLAWLDLRTLSDYGRLNPRWPMRALAGIIVEAKVRGDVV